MKSKIDEIINTTSNKDYDELIREQYIVDLDIGEKVQIKILDKDNKVLDEKEFIAKYVNCHINCQWQDKGIKKELEKKI
ncbi:unnamed protein product [marine sediment metagenome]|uniref:Uncharacterized protein n=1 Tax=marine sediment metagenome TaxID=412755 RepID=X1BZ64_9ZZZZ